MKVWWIELAGYARPQSVGLLLIGLTMLLSIACGLLTPWPMKLIVDNVLSGHPLPTSLTWIRSLPGATSNSRLLAWLSAGTVFVFLVRHSLTVLQSYLKTGVGNRMSFRLAAHVFDAIQRRSLLFHRHQRTGDLIRRITADTICVRELILDVFLPLLTSLLTIVAMVVIMWQMSPLLAGVALSLALPLTLVIRFFVRPMSQRKFEEWEIQGELNSLAEQTLSALPIVQAFGRESLEDDRFRQTANRSVQASWRSEIAQHQFTFSTGAIAAVGTATVMLIGAQAVLAGQLSVGSLLVLMAYFAALYAPIETMAHLSEAFASAAAGARRINEILSAPDATISDPAGAVAITESARLAGIRVRLDNVSFGYQAKNPAIENITFEIAPGEMVALVGPTGSGKSTIACLIPRLFDPWRGTVFFNQWDVRQLQVASVRSAVSIVPQEPLLLPLSIADNIAYARPTATRAEIIAAAQAANADSFISRLPAGYDTVIGERGATLSGGERQRLSIARALLKDAPILVLDEATAALDAHTETSLVETIVRLVKGRSTLVIAHRLSTIRIADRIVVIDQGKIVEVGSHDQLMEKGGAYYALMQRHATGRATANIQL